MDVSELLLGIRSFPLTSYFIHSLELMLGYLLFTRKLKRQKHFAIRMTVSVIILVPLMVLAAWAVSSLTPALSHLVMFFLSILLVPVCFACDLWTTLVCATTTVVTQNLAYCLAAVPAAAFGHNPVDITLPIILIEVPIYLGVHYACYLWYERKSSPQQKMTVERLPIAIVSVILLIIIYGVQYDKQEYPATYDFFLWKFLFIACDLLALFMIFNLYDLMRLKQFSLVQEQMLIKQQKQYEMSKSAIEIVNFKCHDLKHQIKAIRNMAEEEREACLQELEKAVMIYENTAKTGNAAMDVIITEKGLLCEKYHIRFTYIVDGGKLDFIKPVDIYAIFCNALDNAIEASTLVEEEKRLINLTVKANEMLLQIHMENYCGVSYQFEDGFPVVRRDETYTHGYGLRSIRHICGNYGGMMKTSSRNGLFCLDITIPIAASAQT